MPSSYARLLPAICAAKIGALPAAHAADTLVYVAPLNNDWAQIDVGFICQNVYLFYRLRRDERAALRHAWAAGECRGSRGTQATLR